MFLPCRDNDIKQPSFKDENKQGQTSDRRSYFVDRHCYKRPVTDRQWRNFIGTAALLWWRLTPPNSCSLPADGSSEGKNVSTCVETLSNLPPTNGLPTTKNSWASVGQPWITYVPMLMYVRYLTSAMSANDGIVCWAVVTSSILTPAKSQLRVTFTNRVLGWNIPAPTSRCCNVSLIHNCFRT